jgi:hypothetical protein
MTAGVRRRGIAGLRRSAPAVAVAPSFRRQSAFACRQLRERNRMPVELVAPRGRSFASDVRFSEGRCRNPLHLRWRFPVRFMKIKKLAPRYVPCCYTDGGHHGSADDALFRAARASLAIRCRCVKSRPWRNY